MVLSITTCCLLLLHLLRAIESTLNAATVPLNVGIGGLARGDLGPMRKMGFMYSRWFDIMKNSTNYAKQVFRRSGMTAEELPLFDSSVKLANQKQLEFMRRLVKPTLSVVNSVLWLCMSRLKL